MSRIRPSTLPKLAACACYESNHVVGPAAERGTQMDGAFRAYYHTGDMVSGLDGEQVAAIIWAADALKALADGAEVITEESLCEIQISADLKGTADAICVDRYFHADLKSGQIRNYREQMAAYAVGFMEREFLDQWDAHLLFCDQKKVITYHFALEEAKSIVQAVIDRANNPERQPTVCDYCSWCAKVETCAPRMQAMESALATTEIDFAAVLADPEKLGQFLSNCKVFAKFWESAEASARKFLEEGKEVPGWRLQKGRKSEYVSVQNQLDALMVIKPQSLIEAHGPISAKKFLEIWPKELPLPPEVIESKTAKQSLIQH